LPKDVAIDGTFGIGQIPNGFGIEVELKISMPGMDSAEAQERPVRRP
jgi:osmotically inducible protein OsmC